MFKKSFYLLSIIIIFILFSFNKLKAEDTIITIKNTIIKCNILSEDSIIVIYRLPFSYYNEESENRIIKDEVIDRKEIKLIKYGKRRNLVPLDKNSVGLGIGLDYGGFGVNLGLNTNTFFGIFGGFGTTFASFSYNAGIKIRLIKDSTRAFVIPFLLAMYGNNATIIIKNYSDLNKAFYGFSVGIGMEFLSDELPQNYWSCSIIYPFRKEAEDYVNNLKNNGVKFESSFLPVTISIGYRIALGIF